MSDPVPFRLRVLIALTDVLGAIVRAGEIPYGYDLSAAVFRGRDLFGDDDPLPMLSILESPSPADANMQGNGGASSSGDWELIVQGFVQDDPQNPTDPGHYLMADVKRVLAAERAKGADFDILGMGGKVTDLRWGSGVVRPSDENSARAYFWLSVTLGLVENQTDPFA